MDAAFARKEGALAASTETSFAGCATCTFQNSVKATLSDNTAWAVTAKYDGGKDNYKLFGGYEVITQGNSSNPEHLGLGSQILGTPYLIGTLVDNAFDSDKVQQMWWVGGKYNLLPNLTATVAYYHVSQNAYLAGSPAGALPSSGTAKAGTNCGVFGSESSNCKGSEYAASFLMDYQWTKRIDIYGGVMYSKAEGGYASGFLASDSNADNTSVTVGTRLKF